MAAGLVTHDITTAAGVTFKVTSWVPDTSAPNVGAVPVAMLTDGALMAAIGSGPKANALRVEYANDGNVITTNTTITAALPGGTAHIGEVKIDPTQLGSLITSAVPVISGGYDWTFVPASSTAGVTLPSTVLGSYLEHLMCIVTNAATSKVQIQDGSDTVRDILPDAVAGGIGTYVLPLGITSKVGPWKVITPGAGVAVIATFKAS